ncbi:PIN domain-containing protein [Micromonospora sp. NPDC085948]|uniref:PIN domain-containing protein n=1 Tax=Micromonospora sp. NPDC085948 TaxID=3155293 RepID=UPI003446CE43
MLINPLPGTSHKALYSALTDLRFAISNQQNSSQFIASESATAYLAWMQEARRRLRNQVRAGDLERLVPTKSYEVLLSALSSFTVHASGDLVVKALVNQQLTERSDDFQAAIDDLQQQTQRFAGDDVLVVLDTNVFMHHPQEIEDLDVHALIHRAFEPLRVVVPMVVVDELDRLKRTGDGKARARARYGVAYIDRMYRTGGLIRPADLSNDETARGMLKLDVLFDSPGHIRQSRADDEIIDRAVVLQTLASRPVHLVTYDTGMAMRALNSGLRDIKLQQEPENDQVKQSRQPRQGATYRPN